MPNKRMLIIGGSVLAVLVIAVGGFFLYRNAGADAFAAGMAAYQLGDCSIAEEYLPRVAGFYKLASRQNAQTAQATREECAFLLFGQEAEASGDYLAAISSYDAYLDAYPGSPISQSAIDLAFGAYTRWAADLRQENDYAQAIEKYQAALETYPYANGVPTGPEEIAKIYLEWSAYLRGNGEYEAAIEKCSLVMTNFIGLSDTVGAPGEMGAIFADWSSSLQEEGDFAQAIAVLQRLERDYPSLPAAGTAEDSIASILVNWAASLRESSEFELAVEKYKQVLDEHGGSPSAAVAQEQLPEAYLQWGTSLQESGEATAAVEAFETLVNDYPDSPAAEKARGLLAQAYLDMGAELLAEGKFSDATAAYQSVETYTDDADLLSQGEDGMNQVIAGLAKDTGPEGQALMEETLEQVCGGEPKTNPSVNFNTEEEGKFLICPKEAPEAFSLTDDVEAKYPGHFRYVVKITVKATNLDRAFYYGPGGIAVLYRQRLDWEVTVISVETGEVVGKQVFLGEEPGPFPQTWAFTAPVNYYPGPAPAVSDVNVWLNSTFK